MSIFQFPTASNPGIVRDPLVIEPSQSGKYSLPDKYTNVPAAVSGHSSNLTISEYIPPSDNSGVLDAGKAEEEKWVTQSLQLLDQVEKITKEQCVSWAAFHASSASDPLDPLVINCLLPLFREKAATLSMVKHGTRISSNN